MTQSLTLLPEAKRILRNHDLPLLAASADVICVCDDQFRLLGYNPAWERFARRNGGEEMLQRWPLGSDLLAGEPDRMRAFYAAGYERALATGVPFRHQYECSSADTFRGFLQVAYPLGRGEGLLITHSLHEERPMDRKGQAFSHRYLDRNGLIVQCSHCRRVARQDGVNAWDWVPELVENPDPRVSHTFCTWCLDHYHPPERGNAAGRGG